MTCPSTERLRRRTVSTTGDPIGFRAEPFDLEQVRLLDGPYHAATLRNREYLHYLDADRLLHLFRLRAGLPSSVEPLAGWEAPLCVFQGAFTGNYLTACMLMYLSTGDEALKDKADYMVAELAKCQKAIGTGYLSAFPEMYFDDLEAMEPARTASSRPRGSCFTKS